MLADTRREDDRVEPAERDRIRADVLAQPVGGDIEGELSRRGRWRRRARPPRGSRWYRSVP